MSIPSKSHSTYMSCPNVTGIVVLLLSPKSSSENLINLPRAHTAIMEQFYISTLENSEIKK